MNGKYEHGGDIYEHQVELDFSANINPLGMHEDIKKAVIQAVEVADRYPDVRYLDLIKGIARKHQTSSRYVILGNGAADLIYTLVHTVRPSKGLLITPSFNEYEKAFQSVDCECVYFPVNEDTSFQITEDILHYLTEDMDMMFLCNPNNPTGTLIENSLLLRIIQTCHHRRILLCVDECFIDFVTGAVPLPIGEYFILRAFTKMYAIPGLRLGYGLSSNEVLLERMEACRQAWPISNLAQVAGEAALQLKGVEEMTREYVAQEREYLQRELTALGFEITDAKANYVFFRAYYGIGTERRVWTSLKQDLLLCGINLRDCSNYRGLGEGYYRVGVRKKEENQVLIKKIIFFQKKCGFF